MLDVSSRTILHRVVPPELHGRVFGVLEGIAMLGLAAGSMLVPLAIAIGGASAALYMLGVLMFLIAGAVRAPADGAGTRCPDLEVELDLLRGSPLFSMLAAPVLEELARALALEHAALGEAITREGEAGERFYLLLDGELAVSIGGEASCAGSSLDTGSGRFARSATVSGRPA